MVVDCVQSEVGPVRLFYTRFSLSKKWVALLTMDKFALMFEYISRTIGDEFGGGGNVSLAKVLESRGYQTFKENIEKSLSFNVVSEEET